MTTSVSTALGAQHVIVEPGQERETEFLIRNDGDEMDQFTVSALGPAARWTTVEPTAVTLMPGDQETVRVTYAPPRSADTRVGESHVAFRVTSHANPGESAIEEAVVEVKPFTQVDIRIDPPKRSAMRQGKYKLIVENRGNTAVECQAVGYPSEDTSELEIVLAYSDFVSEPGTSTEINLKAVADRRFMRGQPVVMPFAVEVSGDLLDRPTIAEAILTQVPTVNRRSITLAAAVLALALMCGGAWALMAYDPASAEAAPGQNANPGDASPQGVAPGAPLPGAANGSAGAVGESGAAGADGLGVPGAAGLPGAPGLAGVPGDAGTPGLAGDPGAAGQAGDAGAAGRQGLPGERGAQGGQGEAGLPGLQGLRGETGTQGSSGSPGADGAAGGSPPAPALLQPRQTGGGFVTELPLSHVRASGPSQVYLLTLRPDTPATADPVVTRARYTPVAPAGAPAQASTLEVFPADPAAPAQPIPAGDATPTTLTRPRTLSTTAPLIVRVTCAPAVTTPCLGSLELLPPIPPTTTTAAPTS